MELLEYALRREGYDVSRAYDGESAVEAVTREKPDLVVLDLNLPKLAGFVVLERIRHQDEHVAVLLLSARQDESDILRGLQLGADDYITKPFRPKELVARVKAILRRSVRTRGRPAPSGSKRAGSDSVFRSAEPSSTRRAVTSRSRAPLDAEPRYTSHCRRLATWLRRQRTNKASSR